MTNEPGQIEKGQIPSKKKQLIIVNSPPGSMPKPLENEEGIWLPHRFVTNPDGKEIVASWEWHPQKNIPIIDEKLEKLEEERFKKDPSYYEGRRTLHMSDKEIRQYKENKRLLFEAGKRENFGKSVSLTKEMVDWAASPNEENLNNIMRNIRKHRDQDLLKKMEEQQERYGQGGIYNSQPTGDKD